MSTVKKYLRIARRTLWYSLVTLLVILAVLVSLFRIFLPDLTAYRADLEQLASAFMDHTVKIESMDARLVGFTPMLIFDDVYMLDKSGERELVRFKQARLGVAVFESIRQRQVVPRDFTIDGIQLAITRQEDGRFLLQGVDVQDLEKTFQPDRARGSAELADWLFKRSSLALRNSTILWKDLKQDGETLRFDDVNLTLRNDNQRHQLNGQVNLPQRMGKHFDIAMDVRGNVLNPREMKGKIYMRGDGVQLDQWGVKPAYMGVSLHSGMADFQFWGDWEDNAIQQMSGDLTAYDLKLSLPIMDKPYDIQLMGGLFDVDNQGDGWRLNVDRFQYMSDDDVWPQTRFSIGYQEDKKDTSEWRVDTDYFRVDDVANFLLQTNLLDEQQTEFLQTAKPAGDVQSLHLRHSTNSQESGEYRFQARFEELIAQPWRRLPGVEGLQGRVVADNRQGRLQLAPGSAVLDLPRLFREPIKMTSFLGDVHWQDVGDSWRVHSDDLQVDSDDIEVAANLLLTLPKQSSISPYLDLQATFENGKAASARRYYPTGVMKPKLVNWLDRSIVDGHVSQGGLVFNGRLKDFPFRERQGQFKIEFDARDVALDYRQQWPELEGVDLAAVFTGQRMELLIERGKLFGLRLSPSRARIGNFKAPQLQLQMDANGGLGDVARFLTESPVVPRGHTFVQRSGIKGRAHTRFEAMIPLNARMQERSPLRYQGELNIAGGQLHLLEGQLDMTDIGGQVVFDQEGVSSEGLRSQVLGEPVELMLDSQQLAQGNKQVSILANGQLDAGRLAEHFAVPWSAAVSGKSSWHGAVVLESGTGSGQPPLVRIDSTLEGIRSDLPSPLNKPAEAVSRLLTEVRFVDESRSRISVNLADKLDVLLELAHSKPQTGLARGALHFGPGSANMPADRMLLISGALDHFDPDAWRSLTASSQQSGSRGSGVNLPIRLAMDRLGIVKGADSRDEELAEPSKNDPPPPDNFPAISAHIDQLEYGETRLGSLDFETRTLQKGLSLRHLMLQGENLNLHASGDWLYESGQHASHVNFEMTSPNLGRFLTSRDYSAIIEDGRAVIRGDLNWAGPPAGLTPDLLGGNIQLRVDNGSIVKVKPGAGRLLGLFSLSALPRRLMLDFRDTFQEGFSFDEMRGRIRLRDGDAYSDNLRISSPVAEIRIQGRTGLVARDFDQRVTVTPRVGDSLPIAGGLLFGTQVGAAILFLEKLFGGGIDKASAKRYHVTGSWEDPVITPLDSVPE
ncbi:MAG: YhdP family protein [Thiohalophilus sp.]